MKDQQPSDQRLFHLEAGTPIFETQAEREKSENVVIQQEQREIIRSQLKLQWGMLLTQVLLVIFGLGGLGIGMYQAHQSKISADSSVQSTQNAARAIAIEKRAFLTIGKVEMVIPWRLIRIPVRNYGQTKIQNATLMLIFERKRGDLSLDTRVWGNVNWKDHKWLAPTWGGDIPPGDAKYTLDLYLPPMSKSDFIELIHDKQRIYITGNISYESGFGEPDAVSICFVYHGNLWYDCGGILPQVDLSEAPHGWADTPLNPYLDVKPNSAPAHK